MTMVQEQTDPAMAAAKDYFALLNLWEKHTAHLHDDLRDVVAKSHFEAHLKLIATPATSLAGVLAKLEVMWPDNELELGENSFPLEHPTLQSVKRDLRAQLQSEAASQD